MKKINLPLDENTIESLSAGDSVLISGQMFTSRDAGHKRLVAMIEKGEKLLLCTDGLTNHVSEDEIINEVINAIIDMNKIFVRNLSIF